MTKQDAAFNEAYNKLTEPQKKLVLSYMQDISGDNVKPWHTLTTAAGIIGVTYRTALEYIRTGKLKAHKVAGKWAVYHDDLKAFIEGR